jgi:hypothetical protein
MRNQNVAASVPQSADSNPRSQTIPIAAPPCIFSRAFVQSGFNEVALEALAAPSRERDLTEPSRFNNVRKAIILLEKFMLDRQSGRLGIKLLNQPLQDLIQDLQKLNQKVK